MFFLSRDAIEISIRVLEHGNYVSNNSGCIMPLLKLVYIARKYFSGERCVPYASCFCYSQEIFIMYVETFISSEVLHLYAFAQR